MKFKLLRLTLLSVLALMFGASAWAADPITATWDFTSSANPRAEAFYQNEIGNLASNVEGVELIIDATNGKFDSKVNRTGDAHITKGTIIKVPVGSTKDQITIAGNWQVHYTIGSEAEAVEDLNKTYTATAADVAARYVTITSTDNNNYFYSITVVLNESEGGEKPEESADKDITATWDYANADIMTATMAFNGSSETGTVKAIEDNGILMTVIANGAGFRANGNNIQIGNGAEFRVPVKNAGDLVVVTGYPNYAQYTVGNIIVSSTGGNGATPNAEYKAKASDVEKGYVSITSNNNNNYYYKISVTQYAPKPATTLDGETVTATFPFNLGTEGQKATFSDGDADYFLGSKASYGSNLKLNGKDAKSQGQTVFQTLSQESTSSEAGAISFVITPKPGFTFTPTKVSFDAAKYGTDNGKLDIEWQNADKTRLPIANTVTPNRDSKTKHSFDITGASIGEGACGLVIKLFGLQSGKNFGLSDIVIEGTLSGTEKELPIMTSFTINGEKYDAEKLFDGGYEAAIELSKTVAMVSATNPVKDIEMIAGEAGEVTYNGDDTQCTVTIPVTAGATTLNYVLTVTQKPDFTLTYKNTDGSDMGTQKVEKDATITAFSVNYATAKADDGMKVRGWFKAATGGEKFTVNDVITKDVTLYAVQTEIEEASQSKTYTFDLTKQTFYAEDHEAFTPTGGAWHDAQHGWAFNAGDKFDLLVGTEANIAFGICFYSGASAVIKCGDEEKSAKTETKEDDGQIIYFTHKGESGPLTFEIVGGQAYLHNIKISNTAELNFTMDDNGWFFVKQGDASSFLDALSYVNGLNASKDAKRAFIFLPNGIYDLGTTVLTPVSGNNISIIGESIEGVTIKNRPEVESINETATLLNSGSNNYLQDLTLDCIAPWGGSAERGVTLQDKGNQTICKNVYLKGLQDTYYSNNGNSTYYFEDGRIEGSVDYVCGNGDVYFNGVQFYTVNKSTGNAGGCIAAPNTLKSFGYIFNKCTLDGMTNENGKYRLGRPWAGGTMIRMINTTMNILPKAEGWDEWSTDPAKQNSVKQYAEYNSIDANGNAIDLNDRKKSFKAATENPVSNNPVLTAEQAAACAVDQIFAGSWKPFELAAQLEAPIAEYKDGVITITPADNGAIAYLIEKNGQYVGITATFTYTIGEIGNDDELTIRAANGRGGFGKSKVVSKTGTSIKAINAAIERGEQVIYNLSGQRVNKATRGLYIVNGNKVVIK